MDVASRKGDCGEGWSRSKRDAGVSEGPGFGACVPSRMLGCPRSPPRGPSEGPHGPSVLFRVGVGVRSVPSFVRLVSVLNRDPFPFGKGNPSVSNDPTRCRWGERDVVGPSRDEKTLFATTNHEHGHLHGTSAWPIAREGSVRSEGEVWEIQGSKCGWIIPREDGAK